jgi:hypothetical protein
MALLESTYQFFKMTAPVLIALELIEAGAGRRQQYCVAGLRLRPCIGYGLIECPGLYEAYRAFEL